MSAATANRLANRLMDALAPIVKELRDTSALSGPATEAYIAELLYDRCHGRQDVLQAEAPTLEADEITDREFVERLSDANSGIGPEHRDWTVCAIEDEGRFAVECDDLTLWIDAPGPVALGQRVPIRLPKEYRNLYPGHYVVIGDADEGAFGDSLRLYWDVDPDGAEALIRLLTATFNGAKIPFRLKALSSPSAYTRADAAILYLPRTHRTAGAAATRQVYREIHSRLRAPVSSLVLQLAPGLGLAEDTVDGSSFGVHRSLLLAPLLHAALSEADTLGALATALEAQGYSPSRFYANPGSTDSYPEFHIDVG